MRSLVTVITVFGMSSLWACSVPDKQPETTDGGTDGSDVDPTGIPDTTITSAPAEFSPSGTATFEFEASKPGARFECMVDGDPIGACTSPFSKALSDGTHSFSVRAISASGESDTTPAEHLWSIDTVAPITTLTEAPPAADNSTMVHFSFMANEMYASFECSLDGAPFAPCRNGDEFGPVGDGPHSFSVAAKDRAGNLDSSPAIHTWSVDTSTPDTTLLSGPVGNTGTGDATFTFLSPDAGPGATFECSLDGAGFTACTSPAAYSGLDMAVHTFSVRVKDATGNFDPTPATRTWTVDLTAPETTLTDPPSGTVSMASALISFTSNENDVTFTCSLDGRSPAACTSPFSATMLAQGPHSFSVVATDMAGHTDETPATATWDVDTVTPVLSITAGPDEGASSGPFVAITWTASEGNVECRLETETAFRACPNPFTFNAPPGAHMFLLQATDAAGNTTSLTRNFTIDCAAAAATGAVGLLALDDGSQVQANAAGGASATLGTTDQPEASDPTSAAGRFAAGLDFNANESDVVAWPLAAGTSAAFTISFWARAGIASGTRDVLVSGDSRVAIRVTSDSATTVRYSATVVDADNVMHTVTSASYPAADWHQVVVSLSEPALRLWVDADRTEIADARMGMPPALDAVRLGGNFVGSLDEVWIGTAATTTDTPVLAGYCPWSETRI
jgi:hypothetical protein